MGLKSVVQAVQPVFEFLSSVWAALPNMIQYLVYLAFGLAILLTVFRSLWG